MTVLAMNRDEILRLHELQQKFLFFLAAAGENDDALGIESANVLRPDDHAVGDTQQLERVGNLDVVDHAAPDEGDFAVYARGNVDDLLNAVNGRSEAGQNHAPRRGAAKFFDARNDGALRGCKTGALHVRGIAEQRQHALVAIPGERVQIERGAAHGSLIDFEIAGVDDDAERRANGQGDAIHGAVRHGNEFDFKGADFHETAGYYFAKRGRLQKPRFVESFFYQRQREARPVHGNIQIAQDVGQGANVVFMAMRQHDSANLRAVLFEIGDVGNDQVDAQE